MAQTEFRLQYKCGGLSASVVTRNTDTVDTLTKAIKEDYILRRPATNTLDDFVVMVAGKILPLDSLVGDNKLQEATELTVVRMDFQ